VKTLALLFLTWQAAVNGQTPAARTEKAAQSATVKALAKPAAAAAAPSVKNLKFPPLGAIRIPQVEVYTLPNGMKIYLLEDHELPVVNGTARVRTGNLFDPADKVGLAGLTGTVMRSGGTRDKTGDQLDEQLENVAASVESSIGETSGAVSFSAMKESTEQVMTAFRDVLTAPEFRADKIDLAKTQTASGISRRNDEARGIVEREFANTVYGRNTPYGWQLEYSTIDAIERTDVVNFYQRYFFPANVTLAVWGDFQTAEMKARIEKLFGGWTVQQPPVPAFPKVTAAPQPGIFLAAKTDVTQTSFAIGHLGGEFRDQDYPALEVMADILGGGFRSRLFQRVRTRMGAAYEVSAAWGATYDHPGLFQISGSTKSASTVETLKAVQEELERIRTTEVTEAELKIAKESALNSLVFAFDTKAKTLGRMLTYEYFGYPKDFIEQYRKALQAVTRADVLRVAKQHLNPANLTIMTVGNPAEFGTKLDSLGGTVRPVDITIPEPKAAAAKVDAASLAGGRQLLAKVQQAAGGAAKLAAVKDVAAVLAFEADAAVGGMKAKQTNRWVAPNHLRQETEMPLGKFTVYSDGKTGWMRTPQGVGPLGGPPLKQVQGDLFRQYFRLLSADSLGYRVVQVAGDTLEISDAASGQSARLTINPATSLPLRLSYKPVQVSGPPAMVEESYAGFRDVGGIKVPSRIAIEQGGRKFATLTVQDYKINTGATPDELAAKPK
jgi:zinc protease